MDDDVRLRAHLEDLFRRAADQYAIEATGFLDLHQQSLVKAFLSAKKGWDDIVWVWAGGYDDAERKRLLLHPDFLPADPGDYLGVLRITAAGSSGALTHRACLGALLGTGIDRRETGDILVREDGADIIINPGMGEFLSQMMTSVGRMAVHAEMKEIKALRLPVQRKKEIRTTVAAPRLDTMTAAAFGLSRAKAQAAIRGGRVYVDDVEETRADKMVQSMQKIVLRGMGKAVVTEIGEHRTRKGRLFVCLERFL